jgi:hypothetical protein
LSRASFANQLHVGFPVNQGGNARSQYHVVVNVQDANWPTSAATKLAARLPGLDAVLRGSLLERTVHHSTGCPKCARGEGHPLWVLTVNYPGVKTRQLSLRPEQLPQVRKGLELYRQMKETLEDISELNQESLRMNRDESRHKEREA